MTHVGSGWESLISHLNNMPQFDFFGTHNSYHHPNDLFLLKSNKHRKDDSEAIYCDVILHNKDFSCKFLCNYCKFIFWSCPFEDAEEELLKSYDSSQAKRYYDFRLEGMHQYYRRVDGALWNPSLEGDFLFVSLSG